MVTDKYLDLQLTNNDVAWLQQKTGASHEEAEERVKQISNLVRSVCEELLFRQAVADLEVEQEVN